MSHFTTLVIVDGKMADTPERAQQLAETMLEPFNENEPADPHKEVEATDPEKFYLVHTLREEGRLPEGPVTAQQVVDAYTAHYEGNEEGYFAEDGQICRMSTYNPKSKWDWYVLGGRWSGFFPVKQAVGATAALGRPGVFGNAAEPNTADAIRKADIDFEFKTRAEAIEAEQNWAKWQEALQGVTPEEYESYKTWDQIKAEVEAAGGDWEKVRSAYWDQPVCQALKSMHLFMNTPADFFVPDPEPVAHAKFIARAQRSAFSPYAVLDSEGWHQKGQMGWFGMSSDEQDQEQWNTQVAQLLENLDDDTWLLLYDLHI